MTDRYHLVSFADSRYLPLQEKLGRSLAQFCDHTPWTRDKLLQTTFYSDNKDVLDRKRGCGYWLWKPFIILNRLNDAKNSDDVVMYVDCGDSVNPGIFNYLKTRVSDCLFYEYVFTNYHYTKRDCFVLMSCDSNIFWNAKQVEAGIQIWRNTDFSKRVLTDYLNYCRDRRIITDDPNELGQNLAGFIDHRHDQSVLTNLVTRYGLAKSNNLKDENREHIPSFVKFNTNNVQ